MKVFFYIPLISSTMIALSTNSWIIMWMMLEINLMSFIPIINNHYFKTNFLFKYFIVQVTSSSIFILSLMLMWMLQFNDLKIIDMNFFNSMIAITMSVKLGLIPFHSWYLEVAIDITWMNFLLLTTWQKLIPLIIIFNVPMNSTMYTIIIISSVISSLQGITQNNLRKLFTLSSINHLCWMLISSYLNMTLMFTYFMLYTLLSFNIYKIFQLYGFMYITDILVTPSMPPQLMWLLMTNILSVAGLPPFSGFLIKLMTIQLMMYYELYITFSSAMFTLYFYLKTSYSFILFYSQKNKFSLLNIHLNMKHYIFKKKFYKLYYFILITTALNCILPIIFFMSNN
uniref:NADH-ubiquinone oxidoreductase chain 2 n=1 Tax=Janus sp. TaxID=3003420 RepID=A0A9E8YXH0_9HYME|nr:NADH dehydrogenase subunit 2 [Janus sp.]